MESNILKDKKIVLGITGSISAYKVYEIIRLLRDSDATIFPIMTKNSCYFITPLSVEITSGNKVLIDMFDSPMAHIELAINAHLYLIAPATANFINKFASGIADDLLTTSLLAFRGPVIIAPAMNWRMYQSPQISKSIEYLKKIGVNFVEPEEGKLACGEEGKGRLASVDKILESIVDAFTEKDLSGKHFLITAGPTREYIDPIRYITNKSSGRMGYALAKIAKRRGARVTLISGPSTIPPPLVDKMLFVETTREMMNVLIDNLKDVDTLIMAAAPLDFEPEISYDKKINKNSISSIPLKLSPDILKEILKIKRKPFTVGFAAEWGFNIERAERKLKEKKLDMIVLNDISKKNIGMDADSNQVVIVYKNGRKLIHYKTPLLKKDAIAEIILTKIKEKQFGN